MHQIWAQTNPYLTSIINFNYSIPFSICHNTTKRKELFSLKGTTFVYVLSSDWWIIGLTPKCQVDNFVDKGIILLRIRPMVYETHKTKKVRAKF